MSMPSPFEMGARIGGNIGGAGHRAMQRSSIDDILQQAQQTGDPTQFNNIMGQILRNVDPENRADVINAVKQRQQQLQQQSQGQIISRLLSEDTTPQEREVLLSKAPSDLQKEYFKNIMEQQKALKLQKIKDMPEQQKELESKQKSQEVFNDQANLIKSKFIGTTGKLLPMNILPSARESRGRFEANNAIFLEKLIPALNKGSLAEKHYEKIAEFLPKITESQATQRGKLAALGRMMGVDISILGKQYEKAANNYIKKLGSETVSQVEKAFSEPQQQQNTSNTVTIVLPDGREGVIPAENLQKAIQMGAKQK